MFLTSSDFDKAEMVKPDGSSPYAPISTEESSSDMQSKWERYLIENKLVKREEKKTSSDPSD